MRGEIRLVMDRLTREVWLPVIEEHPDRAEVAGAAFASTIPFMIDRYTPEPGDGSPEKPLELRAADCEADLELAVDELLQISADDFGSEALAVESVHSFYDLLDEYGADQPIETYRELLVGFVDRYSLRYYVSPTCALRATLPGLVTAGYQDLRKICESVDSLRTLISEFEHALAEAVEDPTATRIKTTLAKLFNLLEAVGKKHPDVAGTPANTFGEECQRVTDWPHNSVRDAAEKLYNFVCDYPGIRHAGTPNSAKRPIGPQDLAGICTIMFGFTNYLSEELPQASGLRLERRVRIHAEPLTGSGRTW